MHLSLKSSSGVPLLSHIPLPPPHPFSSSCLLFTDCGKCPGSTLLLRLPRLPHQATLKAPGHVWLLRPDCIAADLSNVLTSGTLGLCCCKVQKRKKARKEVCFKLRVWLLARLDFECRWEGCLLSCTSFPRPRPVSRSDVRCFCWINQCADTWLEKVMKGDHTMLSSSHTQGC